MSTSEEYKGFVETTIDLARDIKSAYSKGKPYVTNHVKRVGKGIAKTGRIIKKVAFNKPILYTGANALAFAGISYLTDSLGTGENGFENNYYSLGAGLGAVGAFWTGLGIQYLRGAWPFTRIDENAYFPLQWFTGHKGRVLEGPATRLFVTPLEKLVRDEEGLPVSVTKRADEKDVKIAFRTADQLQGTMEVQFTYVIPSKEDAKKWYWDLTDPRIKIIDDRVISTLQNVISDIKEMDNGDRRSVGDSATYVGEAIARLNGKYDETSKIRELKKEIEKLEELEKDKTTPKETVKTGLEERLHNEELMIKQEQINQWGVEIRTISTSEPQYDTTSLTILSTKKRAEVEAEAIIQKARGEREASIITAEATRVTSEYYYERAKEMLGNKADPVQITRVALYLNNMDNKQDLARAGATIVDIGEGIPIIPINPSR